MNVDEKEQKNNKNQTPKTDGNYHSSNKTTFSIQFFSLHFFRFFIYLLFLVSLENIKH